MGKELHLWTRIHWSCTIVSIYTVYICIPCIFPHTKWFDDHPISNNWSSKDCAAHFELWKVLVTQECRFLREQKGSTCGLSKLVAPEIDNRLGYPQNPERLCITRDLPKLFGWSPHERSTWESKRDLAKSANTPQNTGLWWLRQPMLAVSHAATVHPSAKQRSMTQHEHSKERHGMFSRTNTHEATNHCQRAINTRNLLRSETKCWNSWFPHERKSKELIQGALWFVTLEIRQLDRTVVMIALSSICCD